MQGSTTTASTPPFAAVALFDFEPSNPDELALAKGTLVRVTAREGSDWLAGYAEDAPSATGIFPAGHAASGP